MPTLTLPEPTFNRLAQLAAARKTTPEALVVAAIEQLPDTPPFLPLTGEAWWKAFHEFNALIEQTASRYPPGFQLDDSREAMYEERLRSQL
ncbi:hypothetical protein [Limnoglobus roseus]|uniref:Uncharacterized protein n=1 Tax=Limnoglobus roseus TaxID=2598579 RepID=A0A5C1A4E3_9BACT|nr:hypothetical protein [Limnoglobus roseus]QEL13959.1 hypothetical protein PX52LOC_00819 [Limnoglobus roseus]